LRNENLASTSPKLFFYFFKFGIALEYFFILLLDYAKYYNFQLFFKIIIENLNFSKEAN